MTSQILLIITMYCGQNIDCVKATSTCVEKFCKKDGKKCGSASNLEVGKEIKHCMELAKYPKK